MIMRYRETHTVHRNFKLDIPDDKIIGVFGSLDAFEEELISNTDRFKYFMGEIGAPYDYMKEEKEWCVTDDKGVFETDYETMMEDEELLEYLHN